MEMKTGQTEMAGEIYRFSERSSGELNEEPWGAQTSKVHSTCLLWRSRTSGCQAVCQNQGHSRASGRQLHSLLEDLPQFWRGNRAQCGHWPSHLLWRTDLWTPTSPGGWYVHLHCPERLHSNSYLHMGPRARQCLMPVYAGPFFHSRGSKSPFAYLFCQCTFPQQLWKAKLEAVCHPVHSPSLRTPEGFPDPWWCIFARWTCHLQPL